MVEAVRDCLIESIGPRGDVSIDDLFRDAVTGMAVVGLDGRYHFANEALCRLLGYESHELIGLRPPDATHPDEREHGSATMRNLLATGGGAEQARTRLVRRDGSVLHAVRTTTVLRDRAGQPIGFFTQVVDITALVQKDDELHRSENRLRAILAHASELTVLADRDGVITYASPAAERLLGQIPSEVQGRSVFEFIHPDEVAQARVAFEERTAIPGAFPAASYRALHRDGTWRHVEVVVTNLFDDPTIDSLVLNVRDVHESRLYQTEVEASERRFRALVGNSWDIISVHGPDGRCLYCSPAVTPQLGYLPEEMVGTDPFARIHPSDTEVAEILERVASGRSDSETFEYRFRHKDGSWRWLQATIRNFLDDPAIAGLVVTSRDVTNRRRRAAQQAAIAALSSHALTGGAVERLSRYTAEMVAEVLQSEHCLVAREDGPGRFRVVAGTGSEARTTLDASGLEHLCPLAAEAIETRRVVVGNSPSTCTGLWAEPTGASGCSAVAAPVNPATGSRGVIVVASCGLDGFSTDDISFLEAVANVLAAAITRRNIEDELRAQALHDELTGLPNRVLLLDRLEWGLRRLEREPGCLAALFVDVDDFKLVNDNLGHTSGDLVVAAVATRITEAVRAADTVARFGGDEFVVLSESAGEEEARALAERIRRAVTRPIELDGRTVSVTVSIGCAVTSDPALSPDDFLAEADMAMYEAKAAGKNGSAVFAPQMRTRVKEHLEAISGITRGLADGEFRLYYQPIVDAITAVPLGYEALARWQHPVRGLLGPEEFIDYAETSGLIVELGEWVLRTACLQAATWRRAGRLSRISVNVSGKQLTGSDIVATVRTVLVETGADPSDISLEVTESAVMADAVKARSVIDALRELGLHIGTDDFGTGHSSLSQLARLPFDFVKIDRAFVRDLQVDDRVEAMLESIVALCRALRLPAVAEGVETTEQLEHLRRLGVPFIQGYLMGRPVPPDQLS